MDIIQAIILGIVQGLTEFLPVSSSGHLEIGKALLGIEVNESLDFTIAVHGATVLSTIVVFRKEIVELILGVLKFKLNYETSYVFKILISMIPVGIVGLFFRDQVESLFEGNLLFVGLMLLLTAALLALSYYFKRDNTRPIGYIDAIVIGIAQALAVLPGLSRSGSTIATGLIIGNNKPEVARFSFLMVILPVLGINFLDIVGGNLGSEQGVGFAALAAGFISAFIAGYLACSWMISLVKKGKLIWFGVYCAIVGTITIIVSLN
ncbi:MAG: undecaprenyl-diphosphate phosphatase [Tenuifilaceae bacterium]